MEPETLDGLFLRSLGEHPDKVAVIEDSGSSTRCDMTYKDLWDTSCIVSETLDQFSKNHPLRTQFIGVCMEQCLIYPAVIIGILSRGFGFACIDPSWPSDKQIDYLRKLRTPLLMHTSEDRRCDSSEKQCRIRIKNTSLYFEKLKIDGNCSNCLHPMAYAVLTSGSTGQPKIVRVPHASVVSNIVSLIKICEVTSRDLIFLSSPPTFDPSVVDIFLAFATGASLLVTNNVVKASASNLLNVLFPPQSALGVTVLQMTPSVFNRWSETELKEIVLGSRTSLRALILGGEPFPSHSKVLRCTGAGNATRIYNIYGITEVSPWASIHQVIPSANPNDSYTISNESSVPLGDPLAHTILQIRDSVTGSIILDGCGEMFIGSSKRVCEIDNENCLDFAPPVFRGTGDIVQTHSDGRIYYVGRKDLIVKRWGCRINLENIERIALSHSSVKSACCVWDEVNHKLYLLVALREAISNLILRRHFLTSTQSERAHMPDEILQVNDVSLTQHGKINRHTVLEILDKKETPQFQLFVAKKFLKLWCEVLGLQTSQEGSFIHFGGNSLLAMILITELENEFGDVPKELSGLLLSGKSLQFICDHLCQFYESKNSSLEASNPSLLPSSHEVIEGKQDECKTPLKLKQNKLITFNLSGKSSSSDLPSLTVSHKCLENLQMNLVWKVDLGKCIDASPLCLEFESGIGIVIGSHSGKFTYVDGTTGEVRWLLNLPHRIEASACPSLCGQYIYIGCHDGALYCIATFDGRVKWSFVTGGIIKCLPVLCNQGNSIIFGSYDSKVYCLNSESGKLEWSTKDDVKGNWLASPLILGDIAIVCSLAGRAYALKTANGNVMWTVTFHQPIFSTPCHLSTPSTTLVVIAEVKGAVICLNALNGVQVWSWQAPGLIYAPLIIVPTSSQNVDMQYQILVSCHDCFLYCLSVTIKNNVLVKWKVNLGASILSAPFPFSIRTSDKSDKLCCVVSNKAGGVAVVGLQDGSIFGKFHAESEVFSSPVVCKDYVYFGCRDNFVYCLRIQSTKLN